MEKKIAKILGAGANAKGVIEPVMVEVEASNGVGIHVVGLPDASVKETLLRTVTAIRSLGFTLPGQKVIINIAPDSRFRRGSNYDLPIAVGILLASEQIVVDESRLNRCVFSGELGLDASIREGEPFRGYEMGRVAAGYVTGELLPCLLTCRTTAREALLETRILPYGFDNLGRLLDVLTGRIVGTSWMATFQQEWGDIVRTVENQKVLIFDKL